MQPGEDARGLDKIREEAFHAFSTLGIPGTKNEEWKYTRIAALFNKEFQLPADPLTGSVSANDLKAMRMDGQTQANELVFVNGFYSFSLSSVSADAVTVISLEEASSNKYQQTINQWLGDSSQYQNDGINALNTAFVHGGVFISIEKGRHVEHPIYIYHITDARAANILSQPRSLMMVNEASQVQVIENYATLGSNESFTNQVMEIIVEKDARVEYYKIQNDGTHTNQVSTTHIRQIGKSFTHTVTISLNGGIVRNNLNVVLDAKNSEAHLYGVVFSVRSQSYRQPYSSR